MCNIKKYFNELLEELGMVYMFIYCNPNEKDKNI